mmetsp:Transcript_47306/g.101871  ORF Transcript_47306/g.101871 Transcript_47306/m.101871 type:complete len:342 (-) Transcript_47306:755-1780(-)
MGSKSSVLPPSPSNDLSGRRSSSLVSAAPPSSPEGELDRWAWSPPSKDFKGNHSKSKRSSSHVQHRSRHGEQRHAPADLSEIRIASSSGVSPEGSPTGSPGFPNLHAEEAPPEAPDVPVPRSAAAVHEAAPGFSKMKAATAGGARVGHDNAAASFSSSSSSSGFSRSTRRTSKTTSTATPASVSRSSWTSSAAEMADNISDVSGASSLFAPRARQNLDEAADKRLLEARRRATNSMEALQMQLRSRSSSGYAGSSLPRTRPRPAPVQVSDDPPPNNSSSSISSALQSSARTSANPSASAAQDSALAPPRAQLEVAAQGSLSARGRGLLRLHRPPWEKQQTD